MGRVLRPLQEMGVACCQKANDYTLPLTIKGNAELVPMRICVRLWPLPKLKSAILYWLDFMPQGTTTVIEPKPTRDHTEKMVILLWR